MKRGIAVALAALTLAACSGTSEDVDWTKYPDGVQQRIDTSQDCRELQDLFDAFADMDDATRTAHGSGTGDVLTYLDDRLEAVGCYQ